MEELEATRRPIEPEGPRSLATRIAAYRHRVPIRRPSDRPRISVSHSCSIYGLGLEYDRPIAALSALPSATHIDVRLTMGSIPAELSWDRASAVPYYVSPTNGNEGRPTLQVSLLRQGLFFRLEYDDRTT